MTKLKTYPCFTKVLFSIVLSLFVTNSTAVNAASATNCNDTLSTNQIVDSLDSYVKKILKTWQLPGMAVAISVNDSVILCKGYGVKEMAPKSGIGFRGVRATNKIASGGVKAVTNRDGDPIDSKTLFQIGSVSKSFTATVMGQLVDEGLLSWDDTIKNILPDFKMYDSWVTENAQVKDIMTHKMGLMEQAGTYIPNLGYDRDDVYKMLALIKPAYSFRGDYQYNNITFVIAEKIIERLTGKSWEENLRDRIFIPAGMKSSALNADGYAGSENVATPHDFSFTQPQLASAMFEFDVPYSDDDPKIVTLPLYGDEQALYWLTGVGPAGSVSSNVEDMIRYAMMHMNNGFIIDNGDTTRVMSEKAMKYIHKGQTITSQSENRTTLYANCWFVEQNDRYRLYFHTGTTWGMTALCFFVPQYKLCGVVLVNSEVGSNPRYAVMNRAIDLVSGGSGGSGGEYVDYNMDYYNKWLADAKKSFAEKNGERVKQEKQHINVADYAKYVGKYAKDSLFGGAEVLLEKGNLYIVIGKRGFKNRLAHVKDNRFEFRSDGHGFPLNFILDENSGEVKELEVEFNYGEERDFGRWYKIEL